MDALDRLFQQEAIDAVIHFAANSLVGESMQVPEQYFRNNVTAGLTLIETMLAHSQALKTIYEKRLALQQIWARTSANGHDMLAAIKEWVHEAEASGIQSLRDFAHQLKTYSLRPAAV